MTTPVSVRKVENKADFKAFFEMPWTVHKDDPNWVPQLLSMRREHLDKKKNPSWQYLEGDYYVAWRGAQPVGTIAAFVNHHHNEVHEENIAWFGFFDVLNDAEVATALLSTAADWAKSSGYDAIRGPQSFTIMDECGLLIDGFTRPVLMMPYNPPYYQTMIENSGLGFAKVMDIVSFYHSWENLANTIVLKRLEKLVERIQRKQRIVVRGLDRKNLSQEFELFKEIYNKAWEKNWGFTPFTAAELDALVESLGMFFDPRLACFAYVGDEPVGFLIGIPDLNIVLQKVYPRPGIPEIFSLVKALWYWKFRPSIDWLRVPLMGVKDGYRNQGVDLAMYNYMLHAIMAEERYQHLDSGWVLETNDAMMRVGESLGLTPYKTYRFYEKQLVRRLIG